MGGGSEWRDCTKSLILFMHLIPIEIQIGTPHKKRCLLYPSYYTSGGQKKSFTHISRGGQQHVSHVKITKTRKTDTVGYLRHSNTIQCRNMCKIHFCSNFLCEHPNLTTYGLSRIGLLMPKKYMEKPRFTQVCISCIYRHS